MHIVCYGDSNTFGYDPRSFFGGRYPAESRWTDVLEKRTGHIVKNCGMNGRTIPRRECELRDFEKSAADESADLLIVMLGSNDLLLGADADTAEQRMAGFLEILQLQRECVLLIAPPPMESGEWVTEERIKAESRLLAEKYRVLAKKTGICFADAGEWNVELSYDGVHFSEAGHRAFAEGIAGVIEMMNR